ncbi:MAG: VTT domain-containing protein [Anaerolineae bacterium]|nr:VTT domain-containing protein [Anaerolineae bacterium]
MIEIVDRKVFHLTCKLPNDPKSRIIFSFLGIIITLLISFALSRLSINFESLAALGYLGIFLATMLGSATLFFPVPHIAAVFAAGAFFDPVGVAVAAGFGSAIGECIGYYIGLRSGGVGRDAKWYPKVESWFNKYGGFAIFVLAVTPNPVFDLVGLVAGLARFPVLKFFYIVLIAKLIRSLIFAYLGSQMR